MGTASRAPDVSPIRLLWARSSQAHERSGATLAFYKVVAGQVGLSNEGKWHHGFSSNQELVDTPDMFRITVQHRGLIWNTFLSTVTLRSNLQRSAAFLVLNPDVVQANFYFLRRTSSYGFSNAVRHGVLEFPFFFILSRKINFITCRSPCELNTQTALPKKGYVNGLTL